MDARQAAEAMREAAAKVAHGFLTGPVCPYGNDKPGGPTWDHTEADICPVCKKNAEESLNTCVEMHSGRIAAAIRALPLPEPPPDPRDATIAILTALIAEGRPYAVMHGADDVVARMDRAVEGMDGVSFKCRYRISLPSGPQDCEWPHCGMKNL